MATRNSVSLSLVYFNDAFAVSVRLFALFCRIVGFDTEKRQREILFLKYVVRF